MDDHINVLEIKAILFGLKSLCKGITESHILVKTDNTSAVSAVNKMGSIKSTSIDITVRAVWEWAINSKNWLTATHIPGVLNVEADKESRDCEMRSEWMLNVSIFENMLKELNFQPDIDIFASRINSQLKNFISYRPDPECVWVDSFTISWSDKKFYAFPPFNCIPKVIQKIWNDRATGILVVPDWPNQPWYNHYLELVVLETTFCSRKDLLFLPQRQGTCHPLHKSLRLRAAVVCGMQ